MVFSPLLAFGVVVGLLFSLCLGAELDFDIVVLSHVMCYGQEDGSAQINLLSGTQPIVILWQDTKESTEIAYKLSAGWHNVTVTDATKMNVTKGVKIAQPSGLQGMSYITQPSSCSASLGVASAMAYGGTPPYSYSWGSSSGDYKMLSTTPSLVVYAESMTSTFKLHDASQSVFTSSIDIAARSGIFTVRIQMAKTQTFSFLCALESSCIDTSVYGGVEFWVYSDTSVDFVVGLLDDVGVSYGTAEFSVTKLGNWTKGFFNTSTIPQNNYSGIYFGFDQGLFYLDDIVLTPKDSSFHPSNGDNASLSLQVDTPTGIYAGAGTYSLKIVDINACSSTMNSIVISQTNPMQSKVMVVNDTSVDVTTVGGTPPYTYKLNHSTSSLDGSFSNLSPGNYSVEITDSRGCKQTVGVEIKRPNPPPAPDPSPPDPFNSFNRYKLVNMLLGALAAVCAGLTVVCGLVVWRRRRDLRPHSPFFCYTILFGAFFGFVAAILALLEDVTWTRVIAFSWTVDISVTIIYGTMFAKSMQILKILDNFTKFVSIDTTDRYMAKIFCLILIPELVILLIWSALNRTILHDETASAVIFWNIFLIYKGIVGFIASFVCFRMRFKFSEYGEIKQIAYCQISLEILLIFLMVFTIVARDKYSELFVAVQSFSVTAITCIPLLVIFTPILSRGFKEWKEDKRTKKWQKLSMYK